MFFRLKSLVALMDRGLAHGSATVCWKTGLVLLFAGRFAVAEMTGSANCGEALEDLAGTSFAVPAEASEETRALGRALAKVDGLLTLFEGRIEGVWAEADKVLDRADATDDPDHRKRLEELYGKMAALTEKLEDQHAQLQASRAALVAACENVQP